jgi:hypothetical protein
MVGSIKQITATLAALEQQVTNLGQEFYDTYGGYLTALGQTTQQQLVMASYRVCTEGYPEAFLKLSMRQRQDLQQALRQLAAKTQANLGTLLQPIEAIELVSASHPPEDSEANQEIDRESSFDNELELLMSMVNRKRKQLPPTNVMERLVQWQAKLESTITDALQTATHAGNRFLQQSRVLPPNLPEPLLEAAAKSAPPDAIAGNSNVLDLFVEAVEHSAADQPDPPSPPEGKSREGSMVLHLVAINLRLAELEFADPTLTAWRNRLRDLSKRLKALGQIYQKTQREKAVAEAQVAWRSTWTND